MDITHVCVVCFHHSTEKGRDELVHYPTEKLLVNKYVKFIIIKVSVFIYQCDACTYVFISFTSLDYSNIASSTQLLKSACIYVSFIIHLYKETTEKLIRGDLHAS